MPLGSGYRLEVLESFQALQQALFRLQERMCRIDANLPGWFAPPTGFPLLPNQTDRENAFDVIAQLEYLDQQKPREIWVGAGLFSASSETLEIIEKLNTTKDRFKAAMLSLKTAKISLNDPYFIEQFDTLLDKQRHSLMAETLRKMGLARLHLKQCYRRIPYFLEKPDSVSWTWANTRAITRISVQQALDLLLKQPKSPITESQVNKLYALNPEEPLARVQTLAPHLRANVVFASPPNNPKRIMVKGPIPLFYLSDDTRLLPRLRPPSDKKGRNLKRLIRSDVKLEPLAFLPSIRVHRYQHSPVV